MTKITLNIPDDELNFFLQLVEKFKYETVAEDFILTQEMKDLLDHRRTTSKEEDYIPWEEAKKQLRLRSNK